MYFVNTIDIQYIEFLLERGLHNHLKESLLEPRFSVLGSIRNKNSLSLPGKIRSCLENNKTILKLFELHMMTDFLLNGRFYPGWTVQEFENIINTQSWFPENSFSLLSKGKWKITPAPVINGRNQGFMCYFVTGLFYGSANKKLWPDWADPLMDHKFKESIITAKTAAKKIAGIPDKGFLLCFPFTILSPSIQFSGSSMGFPIALAFTQLLSGEKYTKNMIATGGIDVNGNILKVKGINRKLEISKEKKYRIFLYPSSGPLLPPWAGMSLICVSDLDQARMFASLYTPGSENQLISFSGMLKDPQQFINNFSAVPHTWLTWAIENKKTENVSKTIISNSNLFKTLVKNFKESLEKGDLERSLAVSSIFSERKILNLSRTFPLSVFKWCTSNLALFNHTGDVASADQWAKNASGLAGFAMKADLESVADFYNYRFILNHNRFYFNPDLPDNLLHLVSTLESVYERLNELEINTFPPLGRLYGSIAQNYAFCGPEYINKVEEYTQKARKALGEDTVPEFYDQWLRQFNYLTYAYLDANNFDKAKTSLFRYLKISAWDELWHLLPELSLWKHAAIIRFLADTGHEDINDYFNWAIDHQNITGKNHPWQLWFFNMGRIAFSLGDNKTAFRLFSKGLDICFSEAMGPTVHMMALLHLSGILQLNRLAGFNISAFVKQINRAAQNINSQYFSILDKRDFISVLKMVWAKPGNLFPFTYR